MVCITFKDFYALEDIQKLKYNAENEKKNIYKPCI